MPRVLKRPAAEVDLFLIWEHISAENPDAADRVLDRLEEIFTLMATQPLMGRERPELAAQLRSFPAENYLIFYFALDDGINVMRVLDGRQDVDPDFFV